MKWEVELGDDFCRELPELPAPVQDEILARALLLGELGPSLGRPYADTLAGSAYANMKELRFDADNGVWRVAFAFDPIRRAILLVAGDKKGRNQRRFYRDLIAEADRRYGRHLASLENG